MSTTVSIGLETRNAQADALARQLDNGSIKLYSGTVPATADDAVTGTLLGTLPLQATSAPAASGGIVSFTTTGVEDTNLANGGTCTFYRTFKSDGTTVVTQGTAATSGGSLTLSDTTLVQGGTVTVTSFQHTIN